MKVADVSVKSVLMLGLLFSQVALSSSLRDTTLSSRIENFRSEAKKALKDNLVLRSDLTSSHYDELLYSDKIEAEAVKKLISFHHTVTGAKIAIKGLIPQVMESSIVEGIIHFHKETLKFSDVGYHFLIGQSGRIYEGRPLPVQGAHTLGLNKENIGIAFIGCYDDKACTEGDLQVTEVTDQLVDSTARLLAFLSSNQGIPLGEQTIKARSLYELELKGATRFPASPGNKIIARMDEIIEKAKTYLENLKFQEVF